jgi:hypothetical protein
MLWAVDQLNLHIPNLKNSVDGLKELIRTGGEEE